MHVQNALFPALVITGSAGVAISFGIYGLAQRDYIFTTRPLDAVSFIVQGNDDPVGLIVGDRSYEAIGNTTDPEDGWILQPADPNRPAVQNRWIFDQYGGIVFYGIPPWREIGRKPINYPTKTIVPKDGTVHRQGNLVTGLKINPIYTFKFDGIDFRSGMTLSFILQATLRLRLPKVAYRNASFVEDISTALNGAANTCKGIDALAFLGDDLDTEGKRELMNAQDRAAYDNQLRTAADKLVTDLIGRIMAINNRTTITRGTEIIEKSLARITGYEVTGVKLIDVKPGLNVKAVREEITRLRTEKVKTREAEEKKQQAIKASEGEAQAIKNVGAAKAEALTAQVKSMNGQGAENLARITFAQSMTNVRTLSMSDKGASLLLTGDEGVTKPATPLPASNQPSPPGTPTPP